MTSAISSAKYSGASVSPPTKLKPRSSGSVMLQDAPMAHDSSAGIATGTAAGSRECRSLQSWDQRSTSAMRALYQFMNRLMPRLMVRNTSMMSAMASMACPVWFNVVLAIDTMSW